MLETPARARWLAISEVFRPPWLSQVLALVAQPRAERLRALGRDCDADPARLPAQTEITIPPRPGRAGRGGRGGVG